MDFMIENTEFDLCLLEANHITENAISLFNLSHVYDQNDIMYEAGLSDVVNTVIKAIESIIKAIIDFCTKAVNKVKSLFTTEKKDKLDELVENIDKIENPSEKISIYQSEKMQKAFNVYVKQMLILERKFMSLKVSTSLSKNPMANNTFIVESHKILKEMEELDKKFDIILNDDTKAIVEMAKKDAVRFAEKDLTNVKVDFDAVEKGSKEILQKFKTDANGCEVPEKLNILQKMSNKIATAGRKTTAKMTTYKHKTLFNVLKGAILIAGVGIAAKTVSGSMADAMDTLKKERLLEDKSRKTLSSAPNDSSLKARSMNKINSAIQQTLTNKMVDSAHKIRNKTEVGNTLIHEFNIVQQEFKHVSELAKTDPDKAKIWKSYADKLKNLVIKADDRLNAGDIKGAENLANSIKAFISENRPKE